MRARGRAAHAAAAPRGRLAKVVVVLLGAALAWELSGCATPAEQFHRQALGLGFSSRVVAGDRFSHALYQRGAFENPKRLHVYLEGDGSPRIASRYRPPDPTPKTSLMLRLMALDPAPSLLLGRPCQHQAGPCDPLYWTLGRYGEEVVESLVTALEAERGALGYPEIVLLGYSGGGTLAMLMAERMAETRAVVTIAGNLDTARWAQHHGFRPLVASLDPAKRPPLRPDIVQIHLVAQDDERVPQALTEHAVARQPGARLRVFPGFDHACCWPAAWPAVLEELRQRLDHGT